MFNHFVAILSVISISTAPIFMQKVSYDLSPATITFIRSLISSAILAMIFFTKKNHISFPKKEYKLIVIMGLILIAIPSILFNYGLNIIQATAASFIESTDPIITIIMASLILKEKIKFKHFIGIIFGIIGTLGIASNGFSTNVINNSNLVGVIFVILGATCTAFSNIIGKILLKKISSFELVFWSLLISFIILIPVQLYNINEMFILIKSKYLILYMLGLGSVSTALGFYLYFYALSKLTVSHMAFYSYLVPAMVVVQSYLFLDKNINWGMIFAGITIISGVVIANFERDNNNG